ncbi:glycosyltransferase family 25 protein [Mesorhizobium sp. AR02]|uniref:glycosyltransferase family 25 protein n=1 Tax=Mesorhizobium sp. AR02 TaxID=2865837 RepID=UPI00215EA8BF|nr:glycosyltransferase family 25 protein [Mesorhizobium sp. AR02]UVK51571.1 glycosyltransferase family 25 protein [Mesorhizobium sp. AR02]
MKCLVINLDRSVERLVAVASEFSRIRVAFERVAGVDVEEGLPFAAPPLTATEVCCFLSHRRCWKIIADGPDEYGAVFEDDVVFSYDAGSVLADSSWIPPTADIIKLETFFNRVRLGSQHVAVTEGYSARRLLGQHLGACGYIVSRNAAERLSNSTKRLKAAVDVALFSPNQMTAARNTIYQLVPALCTQAHFVVDKIPPSLVQIAPRAHINKRMIDRVNAEAARAFWYFRNRPFFQAAEKHFSKRQRKLTLCLCEPGLEFPA